MEQQLDVETLRADGCSTYRFMILDRTVSNAVQLTRQHAPLRQQILGWSIVVGIFVAALGCWGGLILAALQIYRRI